MSERDDRDTAAAEWAHRRHEGLTRAERSALHRWLGEHPENARAFEESDRVWDDLSKLDLRALDRGLADGRRRSWRLPAWSAAAAVALAAVLAATAIYAPGGEAYATDRGELRTIRLADGSVVTLGAGSKIVVRFDGKHRRIVLRDGEAVFDVAHDAARPFEVRADDTRVTALGTKFAVKAAPDQVRVEVIRGAVRVAKAESPLIAPFIRNQAVGERIERGERLESPRGEGLRAATHTDPAQVAPWTQGRLVYENASLAEVVDDLNRYSGARVELTDQGLRELRVTAALRQDQAASFLDTLPATLPVRLERQEDGRLLLRPAASG